MALVSTKLQKILVIQTAFIGDLILSTALLKHLRQKYPAAELHLVCRKGLSSLPLSFGLVDKAFEWDKSKKKNFGAFKKELKREGYELVYCPHPSFRSALMAQATGARRRVGFSRWWNRFAFTDRLRRNKNKPEVLRQLSLLGLEDSELMSQIVEFPDSQPYLDRPGRMDPTKRVPEWASISLQSWFAQKDNSKLLDRLELSPPSKEHPWAAIAPGSVWGTKRYTLSHYNEVAKKLTESGYRVIAFGAPNESEDCDAVITGVENAVSLAGKTSLVESAALLYLANILFTNDCGAMHLASLSDTSTVSMFGPTVLGFGYRPWQNNAVVVQNKELGCRPCHHHGPPTCPLGTHECMKSLSPEKVFAARLNLEQ